MGTVRLTITTMSLSSSHEVVGLVEIIDQSSSSSIVAFSPIKATSTGSAAETLAPGSGGSCTRITLRQVRPSHLSTRPCANLSLDLTALRSSHNRYAVVALITAPAHTWIYHTHIRHRQHCHARPRLDSARPPFVCTPRAYCDKPAHVDRHHCAGRSTARALLGSIPQQHIPNAQQHRQHAAPSPVIVDHPAVELRVPLQRWPNA